MKVTLSSLLLLLAAPFASADREGPVSGAMTRVDMFQALLMQSPNAALFGMGKAPVGEASELPVLGKGKKRKGGKGKKPEKKDARKKKDPVDENPALKPLDHCADLYDEAGSYRYARYSTITYCDEFESIGEWTCSLCDKPSVAGLQDTVAWYDEEYNNLGVAGYDPTHNEIVVAFRGTQRESISNWLTNFNYLHSNVGDFEFLQRAQEHYLATHSKDDSKQAWGFIDDILEGKMQVHTGWAEQYKYAAGSDLLPHVLELADKHRQAKIVCTGHSMGGAMAYLCGMDYKSRMPNRNVKVYTYGAPRLFNSEMADFYDAFMGRDSVWRVTNGADLAVQMPPQGEEYQHVGNEVWYVHNKRNVCCCAESMQCSGKLPYWRYTNVEHNLYYLDVEFGMCVPFEDNYSAKTFDHIDPSYEQRVLNRAKSRWESFDQATSNFLDAAMVPLNYKGTAEEASDDFYDEDDVDVDDDDEGSDGGDGSDDGGDDFDGGDDGNDGGDGGDDIGDDFELMAAPGRALKAGRGLAVKLRLRGAAKGDDDDKPEEKEGKKKKAEEEREREKVHSSYMQYGMLMSDDMLAAAEEDDLYGPSSITAQLAKYALEPSQYCRM